MDLSCNRSPLLQTFRSGLSGRPDDHAPLGVVIVDEVLGGGLVRGAVHEIFASASADHSAAMGFALGLAHQVGRDRPLLWVRQDFLDTESGRLHPPGLAEFGLPVARMILVRARDGLGVLRAGADALRCTALGAVVMEFWGEPPALDLTASRRLALAAQTSRVTAFVLRASARPSASSAQTRWRVHAHPSRALAANAPGFPTFRARLMRQRSGPADREWIMEWNRDSQCFADRSACDIAALSGAGLSVSERGALASRSGNGAAADILQRTG